MRKSRIFATATMATALVMAASGCLGGSKADSSSSAATAKTEITIMYAFGGDQNTAFHKDMDAWASQNGLKINYIQSDTFEALIQSKVASGNAPDIAIFPQPGILKDMASKGKIAKLSTQTDVDSIKNDILPGFLDAATVNGEVYGAPISMNVKSLYWYSKKNFAKAGYTAPKTQAELDALITKIKGTGVTPVCYGMESGSATGWPATDWIEDYMLQTNGADVYDKWVSHDIKFDSPEVRKAFAIYNDIIMTDGNVYGGAKKSASLAFATALNPMFGDSPKCYFGKQGNFITQSGFFPAAISKNLDTEVGVFQTPSVNGENPVEGGGDLAAAFTANDTNVKKVMNYLTNDATFGTNMAATGAVLSPHKSFDATKYPNNTIREVAKIAQNASVFRFDGSDQMPAAVGAKSFWTNMVDYTSGTQDLDATLKAIDASWPN
jgi:alpha-glucoside transport system substrate-binding protein